MLVEEVFASIDPEPLGAASLAQVHRAILREDESQQVAIKVQHPNVMDYSYTDMNTIQVLVGGCVSGRGRWWGKGICDGM